MTVTRREFLATGLALTAGAALRAAPNAPANDLAGEMGITMSSVARLKTSSGAPLYTMLEWPRILRDELDMRVLDLNSGVIDSHEPTALEAIRKAAADAGCVLSNMKINRPDVDIGNADVEVQVKAVAECKRWIDTSALLGVRWARPLPLKTEPDRRAFVAAYRELAQYGRERGVRLIVENYGWMSDEADTTIDLIREIGGDVAPSPDTGNWASEAVRYEGLATLFPTAVTCDFKAGKLGPNGEHAAWDLKRCFSIAWDAGFRGPWCFEHAGTDRVALFRELGMLRDMLRGWIKERA